MFHIFVIVSEVNHEMNTFTNSIWGSFKKSLTQRLTLCAMHVIESFTINIEFFTFLLSALTSSQNCRHIPELHPFITEHPSVVIETQFSRLNPNASNNSVNYCSKFTAVVFLKKFVSLSVV